MRLTTSLSARPVVAAARPPQRAPLAAARSLHLARPHQSRPNRLLCRAEKYSSSSDAEGPADFHSLAKQIAGRLASDLAGDEDTYKRLSDWLVGASASDTEGGAAGRSGSDGEEGAALGKAVRVASSLLGGSGGQGSEGAGKGEGSTLGKLAGAAAGYLGGQQVGIPHTDQAAEAGDASLLSRLAAEYLGIDSFALDSVKSWLSNPSSFEERDDSKMVGALVHRLLQSFETHTGESFEGREHQYDWLYQQAQSVLGSSLTRSLVKKLVKAYLGIPSGR